MIAYLHVNKDGATRTLTIVAGPCNGAEFQAGEKIIVSGKREANKVCKARGIRPYNF